MNFSNRIVKWYLKARMTHIRAFRSQPTVVQQRVFQELIKGGKNTEFGRLWHFEAIKTYADFERLVPIGDYETHKPYIERMMLGEGDLLWAGQTEWFSKSSGTTSDKSKFLPVSHQNLYGCHIKGPKDSMTVFYDAFPDATIFYGKGLIMGGAYQHFEPYPKTKFGDVSSIMIDHIPSIFKIPFYTPSMEVALMSEWEAKIERTAQQVIHENVTNIGGVPTWTLVLFRRMLELTGKAHILEIWPNLQVYFHGGVSFEPYREQFKKFLPSEQVKYVEVYNASEGYFAVQDRAEDSDMLLLLDNGIFYEFLPLDELDHSSPKAVPLEAVKLHKNYALVISTNSGLWRYNVGDTVQFTSKTPYRIRVTGRTKHFINVFGEEVMIANTDEAITRTCEMLNATVRDYTVAPIFFDDAGNAGHEWLVEFETPPASLEAFQELLDQNLQAVNSDYEAKRYRNIALKELRLHQVAEGTFHRWLKSKGKYGGQHKIPRLANTRHYLEEILAVQNTALTD